MAGALHWPQGLTLYMDVVQQALAAGYDYLNDHMPAMCKVPFVKLFTLNFTMHFSPIKYRPNLNVAMCKLTYSAMYIQLSNAESETPSRPVPEFSLPNSRVTTAAGSPPVHCCSTRAHPALLWLRC
jgi:hypothetical protein